MDNLVFHLLTLSFIHMKFNLKIFMKFNLKIFTKSNFYIKLYKHIHNNNNNNIMNEIKRSS